MDYNIIKNYNLIKDFIGNFIGNCIGDFVLIVNNKRFLHYFRLYLLIFIASLVISIILGLEYVNIPEKVMFFIKNYTSLKYAKGDMVSLLINNFLVSIIAMYYFYLNGSFKKYFGLLYFIYNGIMAGFAVSYSAIKYNLVIAISMILPHGIIEIPAIMLAISSGWILSDLGGNKLKPPREFVSVSIILFIMFTIAGYIESNITPYIFNTLISYYRS